jgi:hypothetical protein
MGIQASLLFSLVATKISHAGSDQDNYLKYQNNDMIKAWFKGLNRCFRHPNGAYKKIQSMKRNAAVS